MESIKKQGLKDLISIHERALPPTIGCGRTTPDCRIKGFRQCD